MPRQKTCEFCSQPENDCQCKVCLCTICKQVFLSTSRKVFSFEFSSVLDLFTQSQTLVCSAECRSKLRKEKVENCYYFGKIPIARIIRCDPAGHEFSLFLPNGELGGHDTKGPFKSYSEAEQALWNLIPKETHQFVLEK